MTGSGFLCAVHESEDGTSWLLVSVERLDPSDRFVSRPFLTHSGQ
jgi:hypothetical protein